jgi:hypothetical protein
MTPPADFTVCGDAWYMMTPAGLTVTTPFRGDATREAGSLVGPMTAADSPSAISVFRLSLETGMKRDEDGVVLGSTGLPGSQRLHQ